MKLLDGATWPKELEEELRREVDAIPPKNLLQEARNPQLCPPGYRIKESNVGIYRNRLQSVLLKDEASDRTFEFFRKNSFYQHFVCVLSTVALTVGFQSMAEFTGGAKLILGMLLDPRKDVRDLALKFVQSGKPFPPEPEDPDAARSHLAVTFEPFINAFSRVAVAQKVTIINREDEDRQRILSLQESLTKANDMLRDSKKATDEAKHHLKTSEEHVQELLKRIEHLQAEAQSFAQKKRAAEDAHAALEIKYQKAKNRYQNLLQFQEECFQKRDRIATLEREVETLRKRITEHEEELERLHKSVRESDQAVLRAHMEVAPEPVAAPKRTPRERLAEAVNSSIPPNHQSILILLDGHNIINIDPLFASRIGIDSHEEIRKQFVDFMVSNRQFFGPCEIHLYFDGSERNDYSIAPNIKVHYSGGTGEHRADHAILDVLEFYLLSSAYCIVVTEDCDFQREAQQLGSRVIGSRDFMALLPHPYESQ